MRKTVLESPKRVKMELPRLRRQTHDAGLAMRCQIVLHRQGPLLADYRRGVGLSSLVGLACSAA